ncbi:MAG: hypothetical protein ACYC6C_14205 [Coriobacteriia bacterium]
MPELYRLATDIARQLEARYAGDMIGLIHAKGELATRAGFMVTLVSRSDPDDPQKVRRLREVAAELGIAV